MPSLVEIGSVDLKKMKMWKVLYRQMDGWTDDRQSEKLTLAFSSGDQAKIWPFPLCINCHDYLSYMYT